MEPIIDQLSLMNEIIRQVRNVDVNFCGVAEQLPVEPQGLMVMIVNPIHEKFKIV